MCQMVMLAVEELLFSFKIFLINHKYAPHG